MTAPSPEATVTGEVDGTRLDQAVASLFAISRSQAASRIADGDVTVNGAVAMKSQRVVLGDRVALAALPPTPTGADGVALPPIRYEDEHVLVIAKPPGMIVHPGVGRPTGSLVQVLVEAGYTLAAGSGPERPGVVHRLDAGTSGLLVVARTDAAYTGLVAALRDHTVERRYLALVERDLEADHGRVEGAIGRDPADRKRFAVVSGGKHAVTHWRVRARGETPSGRPVTLMACRLETGRTHQIRVHLAAAGHPVAGDPTYGARKSVATELGIDRPFLHAARLAFAHPVDGHRVEVTEPLASDLVEAATRVGMSASDWTLAATDGDLTPP